MCEGGRGFLLAPYVVSGAAASRSGVKAILTNVTAVSLFGQSDSSPPRQAGTESKTDGETSEKATDQGHNERTDRPKGNTPGTDTHLAASLPPPCQPRGAERHLRWYPESANPHIPRL